MRRSTRKPVKLLHVPNVRPVEEYEAAVRSRQAIAGRQAGEQARALQACGANALAYGAWVLVDRRGSEPDRVIFCARRKGQPGWQPPAPELEEVLGPPFVAYARTTDPPEVRGGWGPRWMTTWKPLDVIHVQSAQELKRRQEKRRAKAVAENARRLAAEAEWKRRNETPSLFDTGGHSA